MKMYQLRLRIYMGLSMVAMVMGNCPPDYADECSPPTERMFKYKKTANSYVTPANQRKDLSSEIICQAACDNDALCASFDFSTSGGGCYINPDINTNAAGSLPSSNGTERSCKEFFCGECMIEYQNMTNSYTSSWNMYLHMDISLNACQALCNQDVQCVSFHFSTYSASCYINTNAAASSSSDHGMDNRWKVFTCGNCTYFPYPGKRTVNGREQPGVITPASCLQNCTSSQNCSMAQWDNSANKCFFSLENDVSALVDSASNISYQPRGCKECMFKYEKMASYIYSDNQQEGISSEEACQDVCDQNALCVSFYYDSNLFDAGCSINTNAAAWLSIDDGRNNRWKVFTCGDCTYFPYPGQRTVNFREQSGVATPNSCLQNCSSSQACSMAHWDNSANKCFFSLENVVSTLIDSENDISYQPRGCKQCMFAYPNTANRYISSAKQQTGISLEVGCQEACDQDALCVSFDFSTSNASCYINTNAAASLPRRNGTDNSWKVYTCGVKASTATITASTPTATASTPTATASTPTATASTPTATASTPTATASTPTATASTPTATASTPTATASTPTATASTPTSTASTPTATASTPTATASTPTDTASTPTATASTPTATASTPTATASTPTATASTPTATASTPTATASTPTATASTPTATASTPTATASTPTATASTPTATASTPTTTSSTPTTTAKISTQGTPNISEHGDEGVLQTIDRTTVEYASHATNLQTLPWSPTSISPGGGPSPTNPPINMTTTAAKVTRSQNASSDMATASVSNITNQLNTTNSAGPVEWNTWYDWSHCTASCGGGSYIRFRLCDVTAAANQESQCAHGLIRPEDNMVLGYEWNVTSCNTQPCPVDGMWQHWSVWGDCSATCEKGSARRGRQCDDPIPSFGGATCRGKEAEFRLCDLGACPVTERGPPLLLERVYTDADERLSAKGLAALAMGLVAGLAVLVVAADIPGLVKDLRHKRRPRAGNDIPQG